MHQELPVFLHSDSVVVWCPTLLLTVRCLAAGPLSDHISALLVLDIIDSQDLLIKEAGLNE